MRLLVMIVVMVAAIPLVLGGLVLTLAGIAEAQNEELDRLGDELGADGMSAPRSRWLS